MTAPATSTVYSATFSTSYLLTTAATTGGTVSAGGYIAAGSDVQVSATANTGFYFVNFTGTTTSISNPLTLTMSGPQSITANFAPQVALTVTFTGAPAIAPEFSTFMVPAATNSGATPTITASGACSAGRHNGYDRRAQRHLLVDGDLAGSETFPGCDAYAIHYRGASGARDYLGGAGSHHLRHSAERYAASMRPRLSTARR